MSEIQYFEDSWSIETIALMMKKMNLSSDSIIYDPFSGCGTTAYTANYLGFESISSDKSHLACLFTYNHLNIPTRSEFIRTADVFNNYPIETIFECFTLGELSKINPGSKNFLLCYVICAALLKINWHKNSKFDRKRFLDASKKILEQSKNRELYSSKNKFNNIVYISPFTVNGAISRLKNFKGRLAIITSPPFYFSNRNPKKIELDKIILKNNLFKLTGEQKVLNNEYEDGHKLSKENYLNFLKMLVYFAEYMKCSSIAIDVSLRRKEFKESLEKMLNAFCFDLNYFEDRSLKGENSLIMIGRR